MRENIFEIGEYVEIVCTDGVKFEGFLEDFTDKYFVLSGIGHLFENVKEMRATGQPDE